MTVPLIEYTWKDAWILLALRYALENTEGKQGATVTQNAIIQAGIYINQGTLTIEEITHTMHRLQQDQLVSIHENEKHTRYGLSDAFTDFWKNCAASRMCGMQGQMRAVTDSLIIMQYANHTPPAS